MTTKLYRYYFIKRPPFIGTHPDGAISQESWEPSHAIGYKTNGRRFHGFAVYNHALTFEEIWKYELYPSCETEGIAYYEWRQENSK